MCDNAAGRVLPRVGEVTGGVGALGAERRRGVAVWTHAIGFLCRVNPARFRRPTIWPRR